jgi:hypothetical protein
MLPVFPPPPLHEMLFLCCLNVPSTVDPAPLLNERFTGFTPHRGILPPFVTCYGPSVYLSGDGTQLGTWDSPEPPTVEEAEALRVRRNKHFQVGRQYIVCCLEDFAPCEPEPDSHHETSLRRTDGCEVEWW